MHDSIFPNKVAEGTGEGNIFKGVATFNEQRDVPLVEAGDGIACQYQALLSYAAMAGLRGEEKLKTSCLQQAEQLKAYFNTAWGVHETDLYNRGYTVAGKSTTGWGKENSWFMPLKEIVDINSDRTGKYLDFIDTRLESKEDIPDNIEALSYIPELFFKYHRNEQGWKWLKHIISSVNQVHSSSKLTGKNGDYPEVSYLIVSNIIEDMMGILPEAAQGKILSLSRLPNEIGTLRVENLKIGTKMLALEHEKQQTSSLAYRNGKGRLLWEAGFPGIYKQLYINGVKVSASQREVMGVTYSFTRLELVPGEEKQVSVHP